MSVTTKFRNHHHQHPPQPELELELAIAGFVLPVEISAVAEDSGRALCQGLPVTVRLPDGSSATWHPELVPDATRSRLLRRHHRGYRCPPIIAPASLLQLDAALATLTGPTGVPHNTRARQWPALWSLLESPRSWAAGIPGLTWWVHADPLRLRSADYDGVVCAIAVDASV